MIDSYQALLRLGIILKIIDESALKDPNRNRLIEEFSDSDSMTEREVTLGSKDMGKYGPDYNEDEIEYIDPKEELKKQKKKPKRAITPPRDIEPLVSNFGPKTIPLANVKLPAKEEPEEEEEKERVETGNRTAQPNFAPGPGPVQTPLAGTLPNQGAPLFATQPLNPVEEEKRLDKSMSSKGSGGSTPKEGNLMTPAVASATPGGFTAAEFEKAVKDAKKTEDYNFLPYQK